MKTEKMIQSIKQSIENGNITLEAILKDIKNKQPKWNSKTENLFSGLIYRILTDETLGLLDSEIEAEKYLDIGEANGIWYYGFNLGDSEAIVTSEGNILRNLENDNQILNLFKFNGYIGNIAPIISNRTIRKFYLKEKKEELVKPNELYNQIRDLILYFMDFGEQDEIAGVLTCWILGTYVYPLFHLALQSP